MRAIQNWFCICLSMNFIKWRKNPSFCWKSCARLRLRACAWAIFQINFQTVNVFVINIALCCDCISFLVTSKKFVWICQHVFIFYMNWIGVVVCRIRSRATLSHSYDFTVSIRARLNVVIGEPLIETTVWRANDANSMCLYVMRLFLTVYSECVQCLWCLFVVVVFFFFINFRCLFLRF